MSENGQRAGYAAHEVLLRAGFPYLKTLGMRRLTWYPVDFALGDEGRIYSLSRFERAGTIRAVSYDDVDLGGVGGGYVWPAGIVRDRDEHLYISDEATHQITVLTREGEEVARWGEHGSEPGQLNRPSHMVFDSEEHLWVSDSMNHRVQLFTKDGSYIRGFGSHGREPGQFDTPWGIAVDPEGSVYVVDWRNDRVQKFTAGGEFIMEFGRTGTGTGQLNRPAGIAVDMDGDIYVADRGNDRVLLFDRSGRYVEQFIGDATLSRMGRDYVLANPRVLRLRDMTTLEQQKRLRAPVSVHVDSEGRLFIGDYGCHRIQIYQKEAYALGAADVMPLPRSPTLATV